MTTKQWKYTARHTYTLPDGTTVNVTIRCDYPITPEQFPVLLR